MIGSLIIAAMLVIVFTGVLFTRTFWFIVGGAISLGIIGYLFFWVWIFVVAMMAMA